MVVSSTGENNAEVHSVQKCVRYQPARSMKLLMKAAIIAANPDNKN